MEPLGFPTPSATVIKEHLHNGLSATKPSKPRRRSALAAGEVGSNQAFFFVDSGSSTREKRAHVMRHHIQAKRKQANQADRQSNRGPRYLPWRKKSDADLPSAGETSSTGERNPHDDGSTSDASMATPRPEPAAYSNSESSYAIVSVPKPTSMLSASRKDPFESLPIRLESHEYELADYWTTRLSYWSGQNPIMKERAWQAAMRHPTTFQAVILGYCARWRAQLYNIRDDTMGLFYLSQVERALANPGEGGAQLDEDSMTLALIGLALQEERFGDKQKADHYVQRAVQIARPQTITDQSFKVILFYFLYTMAPRSMAIPAEGAQWLVTFLRGAERLLVVHQTQQLLELVPQRATTFSFESPLYQLLSSGPHPSQVPSDSRLFVVNKNIPTMAWSRTAALIYITTALWDYEHSSRKTARFLDHLIRIVNQHNLDRYPACESLLWLLLEEDYELDLKEPERAWSTGELVKIHKMLPPDLQFRFNETLLSYLMMLPPVIGVDSFEQDLYARIT